MGTNKQTSDRLECVVPNETLSHFKLDQRGWRLGVQREISLNLSRKELKNGTVC